MSGNLFCKAKGVAFGKEDAEWLPKTTPNWCPLVMIPVPHGRLIDAALADERSREPSIYDLTDIPDFLAEQPTVIDSEM